MSSRRRLPLPACRGLALLILVAPALALAQEGAPRVLLQPSLSLGQTVTDSHLGPDSTTRGSEAVTSVGAGLRLGLRGPQVRGSLDYGLTGLLYARDSSSNDVQNRLQAAFQGELVSRHLFLDAQATIAQQAVSALQVQAPDGTTDTRNRAEVRTLLLRPSLTGRLGGAVDLRAAVSLAGTDSGGAGSQADSGNVSASLSLAPAASARFGWSFDANRQYTQFRGGRRTVDDLVTLGLSLRPDIDWQFRLRGGYEANNFQRADGKDTYGQWGAGIEWTPSPRTRVALDGDRRSFGRSHGLSLEHRMRRTVLRYTDRQALTRGSAETAQRLVGAYDLFFELYASQEPDPVAREQLVNSVLERNNLGRDAQVPVGFLTSAVSLQRSQELSLAWEGPRQTVLVSVFGTTSSRVDSVSAGLDDLAGDARVRQRGLSVTVTHRLTGTGGLNLAAVWVRSSESDGLGSDLRSLSVFWTESLGRRVSFSLGVRHAEFDADLDPYTENAVIANLGLRF
jgi:uncharacterized protein (PEP-CTERM system associated)